MARKKLVYTEKVYDYETEADREQHIRVMRIKRYSLKDKYERTDQNFKYTAVFSKS